MGEIHFLEWKQGSVRVPCIMPGWLAAQLWDLVRSADQELVECMVRGLHALSALELDGWAIDISRIAPCLAGLSPQAAGSGFRAHVGGRGGCSVNRMGSEKCQNRCVLGRESGADVGSRDKEQRNAGKSGGHVASSTALVCSSGVGQMMGSLPRDVNILGRCSGPRIVYDGLLGGVCRPCVV